MQTEQHIPATIQEIFTQAAAGLDERRFAIEAELNALSCVITDIQRRKPELWRATDRAGMLVDRIQVLLNYF